MTNLSIGDDTFRVEIEGDATKPSLLLSHALGADLSLWDAQMPALLKAFRVIRYDSCGHGGSPVAGGPCSIARLGHDVLDIIDALELDAVHFLGVSMGGAIGQWLLVHAPHRIERAVLANTTAKFATPAVWNERIADVLENGMAAVVDGTMDRWFSPAFAEHASEKVTAVRAVLESGSPEGYVACCAALRDLDLREALRGIAAPVLIISGRDDTSIGEEATRHLVETIPGAKHVALDARHMSNVEADAAFSTAVVGFLTAKLSTGKTTVKARNLVAGAPTADTRPGQTASRRVGTRRSTAARLPLGAVGKGHATRQSAAKTKPKTGAAERPRVMGKVEHKPGLAKTAKSKTAPTKAKAAPPKTAPPKTAPTKVARTKPIDPKEASAKPKLSKIKPSKTELSGTTPSKAKSAEAKSAEAKSGKAKLGKAEPSKAARDRLAIRPAPKATAKVPAATTKTKVAAPTRRPSAKSLKAMAASQATKASAAKKKAAPAPPSKTGGGAGKTALPLTKSKVAMTRKAAATPARAIVAKTTPSGKASPKAPLAKAAAVKTASTPSAPIKGAKPTGASNTTAKAASRATAKSGRRAS